MPKCLRTGGRNGVSLFDIETPLSQIRNCYALACRMRCSLPVVALCLLASSTEAEVDRLDQLARGALASTDAFAALQAQRPAPRG
ncbi:MAG: hypothetical protein GY953_35160 [bacterium]|nr:hypothetical protein [bacterium]